MMLHPSRPAPQFCPERTVRHEDWVEKQIAAGQAGIVSLLAARRRRAAAAIADAAASLAPELKSLSDTELRSSALAAARKLRECNGQDRESLARCLAAVSEGASRVLFLRPRKVQLMGASALLLRTVAEMATGEGKTLTAALAATIAALCGWPPHVVTVNDYLAKRDAEAMQPLYSLFGLSVTSVISGQQPSERSAAYLCDIVHCTNSELVFDYLRDRMDADSREPELRRALRGLVSGNQDIAAARRLRGLRFAIVDEADSVLIDEARTPLVISQETQRADNGLIYRQAAEVADMLTPVADYQLNAGEGTVILTPRGCRKLEAAGKRLGGAWQSEVLREELAVKALMARRLFHRDEHYIVNDGKVVIVDESTGRAMPDRFWTEGLHQLVELKEGCGISGNKATAASITYQRFFRRYLRLSGMTGTCREVARELWSVYRLAVTPIPPHRPSRRKVVPDRVYPSEDRKWRTIAEEVKRLHGRGAPVLLGTRSVSASETAAAHLARESLSFALLNATQDSKEAAIVADAGRTGRITIATNMAGRGTDIPVSADADALGGLHVIMSERHEAARIDRQLAGRCARQGQAGCFQAFLSMEDPLVTRIDRSGLIRLAAGILIPIFGSAAGRFLLSIAQKRAEMIHARMRAEVLRMDEGLGKLLAFSGEAE